MSTADMMTTRVPAGTRSRIDSTRSVLMAEKARRSGWRVEPSTVSGGVGFSGPMPSVGVGVGCCWSFSSSLRCSWKSWRAASRSWSEA